MLRLAALLTSGSLLIASCIAAHAQQSIAVKTMPVTIPERPIPPSANRQQTITVKTVPVTIPDRPIPSNKPIPLAVSNRGRAVVPPLEFDHPYVGGEVGVVRGDAVAMGKLCNKTSWPVPLGCSRLFGPTCIIYMANDDILHQYGWTVDIVRRHEEGHCNGFPADHRGSRTVEQAERDEKNRRALK
jgi:hypothetical protein